MSGSVSAAFMRSAVSEDQFRSELQLSEELHLAEVAQEAKHHAEMMQQEAELQQQKLLYQSELFAHDMLVDVRLATRDATREGIRQVSQAAASIALADAVLLNTIFLLVSQFNIPSSPSTSSSSSGSGSGVEVTDISALLLGYNIALDVFCVAIAVALIALVGSVLLCLKLQKLASSYEVGKRLRRYQPCSRTHENFNDYYACHCAQLEDWSRRLCLAGSVGNVLGACGWGYMTYYTAFNATGALILFWLPCALAVAVLVVGGHFVPDATREGRLDFVGLSMLHAFDANH